MALAINCLYYSIMAYFDGLHFVAGGHVPRCGVWIDRAMPYYALNFAQSGTLRWQSASGRQQVLRGPLAFWTWPGPRFGYGRWRDETWNQAYITFTGPRARRMADEGLLPACAHPWRAVPNAMRFSDDLHRLLAMVQRPAPTPARAVLLLEDLLLRIHDAAVEPDQARPDPLDELIEAIQARPQQPWSIESLAEQLDLSEVQFRRRFKARAGLPPGAYVLQCRLQRAAAALRDTDDTARQIARDVGYDDPVHFTKLFKRTFGLPPLAYREEARQFE